MYVVCVDGGFVLVGLCWFSVWWVGFLCLACMVLQLLWFVCVLLCSWLLVVFGFVFWFGCWKLVGFGLGVFC